MCFESFFTVLYHMRCRNGQKSTTVHTVGHVVIHYDTLCGSCGVLYECQPHTMCIPAAWAGVRPPMPLCGLWCMMAMLNISDSSLLIPRARLKRSATESLLFVGVTESILNVKACKS